MLKENFKNLIYVFGSIKTGGYQTININVANRLAEKGRRIKILVLSKESSSTYNIHPSIELVYIDAKKISKISLILRMRKYYKKSLPSVIITNTILDYLYSKLASITLEGLKIYWAIHYTKPSTKRKFSIHKKIAKFLNLFKNNFIAIHKSQINFYINNYGFKKEDFKLIYNGVDTEYFIKEKISEKQEHKFIIAHVASIKPLKDQLTLLKAVNELNKTVQNWELIIAGEDRGNMLPVLKSYIINNKIEDKVKFLGNYKEVKKLLNSSDVFVLTSETEALPVSIMEAMACELPIITTDVGGCNELVIESFNGYLLKPKDYKTISKKLLDLYNNKELRKELGQNSRNRVVKYFSENSMVDKYEELLK